jgi:hypothetical protein
MMKRHRKTILTGLVTAAGGLVLLAAGVLLAAQDELLKVETSISPLRLSRGETGKVILKFSLKEGVSINSQPSFIIEFSPGEELVFPKNFYTASDLNIETNEDSGKEYLNLKKPIEIPFTVSLKAKRGVHILEGKVKYFAHPKNEGWCLKSASKFSATYYTRTTVVKKGS